LQALIKQKVVFQFKMDTNETLENLFRMRASKNSSTANDQQHVHDKRTERILRNDPRMQSNTSTYEGIRRSFLEGGLNVQNVLGATTVTESDGIRRSGQVNNVYERAKAVHSLQSGDNSTTPSFYATITPNVHDDKNLRRKDASPASHNLHSSLLSFQATAETANEVADNPYSALSFSTQDIGRRVGANLDGVLEARKRKSDRPSSSQSQTSTMTPIRDNRTFADKAVQTGNTGSIVFEITQDELLNLSADQKNLILSVIKVSRHSNENSLANVCPWCPLISGVSSTRDAKVD
jgi:hypothetical protein